MMNTMMFVRRFLLALILEVAIVRPSVGPSMNVTSPHCVFPFSYGSRSFDSCIPNSRMDRAYWCSKTPDYDRDLQWEFCTILGAEGNPVIAHCTFPFIFEATLYNSCTKEGRADGQLWCATTPNYDQDGHWIVCPAPDAEGRPGMAECTFPFIFKDKTYNSCTNEGRADEQLWCSITPNYDRDGHWIPCPAPASTPSRNSKFQLVLILCLGSGLLCVCITGCCMWVQWRGVKNRLWWYRRTGKDTGDKDGPESIYENIDAKETTHI